MANALKGLSRTVAGVSADMENIDVIGAPVIDLAVIKLSALTLAVEAAAMLASMGSSATVDKI